jgi:DNA-binding transcriptional ArsR family regulator
MINQNQSPEQFQQEDSYLITDVEILKVIADKKRLQILELLCRKPYTVKQLAEEMQLAPTRLYYHIKQLEDHALIRVVSTQVVSGIIEKTYQARARRFSMDQDSLLPTESNVGAALDVAVSILDNTKTDLRRLAAFGAILHKDGQLAPEWGPAEISRRKLYLTLTQAEELQRQLAALIEAQSSEEADNPDSLPYMLVITFYPNPSPSQKEKPDD